MKNKINITKKQLRKLYVQFAMCGERFKELSHKKVEVTKKHYGKNN